jgi:hypothetical protein
MCSLALAFIQYVTEMASISQRSAANLRVHGNLQQAQFKALPAAVISHWLCLPCPSVRESTTSPATLTSIPAAAITSGSS